ncbi:hypothetical protein Bbelb_079240 [Branchiostoma belcheri]|nr:hypothetical protein Bbelb_079240 [Branchiostoma belcheri]
MRTHTVEKPYKCDQCSYSAASNAILSRHMKIHTEAPTFTSDLTRRQKDKAARVPVYVKRKTIIGSRLNMATAGHGYPTGVGQNCCYGSPIGVSQVDCDSKTSDVEDQAAAQVNLNNAGEKPYMCGECGYRTAKQSDLSRHVRTHTGEKPYKCDQCDYSAAQKSSLDYHLVKHTGEKPYMCGECGYRATQKSNLSQHMKTHTGEKPYKCDHCDYSATRKSTLDDHKAKHTPVRNPTCVGSVGTGQL